jgi:hypothetical protein
MDPPPNDKVLLIASDPSAPGEILASLAEHENPEVRARVAGNPNTPQSVLMWLWIEFSPSGPSIITITTKHAPSF